MGAGQIATRFIINMEKRVRRDIRLDITKATAISLVLIWHLKPFQILTSDKSPSYLRILAYGISQFYSQISLIAVPLFILVSLYLYYTNLEDHTNDYLRTRFLRLGGVFLFWSVFQFAIYYGILITNSFHNDSINYELPLPIHRLIMEGGPPLPVVGKSVFYFLFVLLILVLASTAYYSLRNNSRLLSITGISIVTISIIFF